MGGQCAACQALYAPPRAICPQCRGTDMTWVQMRGTGHLAAFTSIALPTPALAAAGYGRDRPYCTGVVGLDEGPRVVARIEGFDALKPQAIRLGTPLVARFHAGRMDEEPQAALAFGPARP